MILAGMISTDEHALICDLAETYHIFDYRSLPVKLVATLSAGLRDDSRIKRKLAGAKGSGEEILLATIADRLGLIIYAFCGGKGDAPGSITEMYYEKQEPKSEYMSFSSPEAFREAWNKATGGH